MEAIPPISSALPSLAQGLSAALPGLTAGDMAARIAVAKEIVTQAQAEAIDTLLTGRTADPLAPRLAAIPIDARAAQAQQLMRVIADADLTLQEMVVVVRTLAGQGPSLPLSAATLISSLVEGWASGWASGWAPTVAPGQPGVPVQTAGPGLPLPPTSDELIPGSPVAPVRVPLGSTASLGAAPFAPPGSRPIHALAPGPQAPTVATLSQGGHVVQLDLALDLVEAIHVLRTALGPSLAPLLPALELAQGPAQGPVPGSAQGPLPASTQAVETQRAVQSALPPSHPAPGDQANPAGVTTEQIRLQTALPDVDLTRLAQATLQIGARTIDLDLTGAALTPHDFAGVSAQINSALQEQGIAVDLWAAYAGIWRQYGGWIALAMPSLLAWRLSLAVPPSRPRRFRRREEEKRKGSERRRR